MMLVAIVALTLSALSLYLSYLAGKKIEGIMPASSEPTDIIKRLTIHKARQKDLKRLIDSIRQKQEEQERQISPSLKSIGLVRFNPYRDTGGDQSFALCILDSNKDGILVTAIHAREGTRIYAKSIEGGNSSHELSNEEQQAVKQALELKK